MTSADMDAYLKELADKAPEYGTERSEATTRGVDLIQAKEVGMLEHNEDEDED